MARNKTAQGGISLRRKVTAWLAAILLVTMLSTGIATMAGQWTVRSFDTLLADNAICYTVQNALKDETRAFARYVRQPTSETEQAYTAACTASEQSLAALPFDYARIGEEGGRILLRAWMQDSVLVLTVTDNGKGMTAEELDAVQAKLAQSEQTGRSIGLGNISRRIGMLYPGGKMQIYSRAGCGTVVRFELPQTQQPEEKEETLS